MRAIGKRRDRNVIAPVGVLAQPEAYDAVEVERAIGKVAEVANGLIDRKPTLSITAGSVTVNRPSITLVAGAGVTITVEDDAATNSATITFTSP